MNIKIYHQISETERDVYEFFIKNNIRGKLVYTYCSYCKSRKDTLHPWGDQWENYYRSEKFSEKREIEREFLKENGYEYGESWEDTTEWDEKFYELDKRYNPIIQKTVDGKPYLSGLCGPSKPVPLIPEKELIQMLNKKLADAMENATISL